jgi:hypothetical protein
MENDLAGQYRKDGEPPLLKNSFLTIGGKNYDRIVLTPLLMDFNMPSAKVDDVYYSQLPVKPLRKQIYDMLDGIRFYLRERPQGMLEIYPFLGLNPANYSFVETKKLLHDFLGLHSISRHLFYKTFQAMRQLDISPAISGKGLFAGLKLYPPLGLDPWPVGHKEEMKKVKYIYEFCQKRTIPITTHCDDQGFRTIPLEQSQEWTAPKHWLPVLSHYPQLKLNFAHFGRQYSKKHGLIRETDWFYDVIEMCCEYDNVYTDFSFTGVKGEFYQFLIEALNKLPKPKKDMMERKILFGSDFMINLLDVDSYYDYFKIFNDAKLTKRQKFKFCSENPARFLFEK